MSGTGSYFPIKLPTSALVLIGIYFIFAVSELPSPSPFFVHNKIMNINTYAKMT